MKIAFLSTFYPYRGGIAQFNGALWAALSRKYPVTAYNFTLQFPSMLFPGTTQYVPPGDTRGAMPSVRTLNSLNPWSYFQTYRTIWQQRPDLLLLSYWTPLLAPAFGTVAFLLRRRGVKVVAILNNLVPHEHRPGDALLNRFFLSQCDGFVVMGQAVKRELLERKPYARWALHPHPVYTHFARRFTREEALARLGIPEGLTVLLFFGLIRPYKGLDVLLEAFARLGPGYALIIAGEPYGDYSAYETQIAQNPHCDRIFVHMRFIPEAEVPVFFGAADWCMLPYKTATQSGVAAIAYDFGLPVVVTDTGNLREMVEGPGTGLVVPPGEPEAIANALFAHNTPERREWFRQNILRWKATYSWETLGEVVVGLARDMQ
jgi:glycosyltransferase involved in cell wall biosynthesis